MAHRARLQVSGIDDDAPHKVFSKEVAMKKVTDLLFSKIFSDPQLRPFFEGISEQVLRHKQETMMEMLFGGADSEKVDLREYHYDMIKFRGLSEHHHELMCKHFQEVMDELGNVLPAETKTAAIAALRATRSHYRPMKPGE